MAWLVLLMFTRPPETVGSAERCRRSDRDVRGARDVGRGYHLGRTAEGGRAAGERGRANRAADELLLLSVTWPPVTVSDPVGLVMKELLLSTFSTPGPLTLTAPLAIRLPPLVALTLPPEMFSDVVEKACRRCWRQCSARPWG